MAGRKGRRPATSLIGLLLEVVDQAFDQKSWHGPTLRGALRGVTPEEALWRPAANRHNIWELTLHAAYWKYAVRRRLAGEAVGSFDRKPSNWPDIPDPADARAWKRDIVFLEGEHRKLREVIDRLTPAALTLRSPRGVWTNAEEIHGIAAHDLYHTGQIQLIKRLMRTPCSRFLAPLGMTAPQSPPAARRPPADSAGTAPKRRLR